MAQSRISLTQLDARKQRRLTSTKQSEAVAQSGNLRTASRHGRTG